ncbi:WD40-repeat-containing domain protein [Haematococcus lacustris]
MPDCDSDSDALTFDIVFRKNFPPSPAPRAQEPIDAAAKKKPVQPAVTCARYCQRKQRFYYGLGVDLCFWPLTPGFEGTGTNRYVGSHKGPVSAICLPGDGDGELGGLILSGSVDGRIIIWDYQGKVTHNPSVCVQSLYGHSGTITGLFCYGHHVISGSTDKTIRVWRAVEGRQQLVYPWYVQTMCFNTSGWVRSMTFDRSTAVGDRGTFYCVDDVGCTLRLEPQDAHDQEGNRTRGCTFVLDPVGLPTLGALPGPPTSISRPPSHDRGVLLVRYVAAWSVLVTLCYDQHCRVWSTASGELKYEWENENRCLFTSLDLNLEHGELLVGDRQGTLAIFSVRSGLLLATKSLGPAAIQHISALAARGMYAVVTDTELSVWRLEHELDYSVLRGGHTRAVISLYACAGGTGLLPDAPDFRIFSAGQDNSLRVWDPYDMQCARVLHEEQSEISAMTFYEAWNILVTGHDNGDIRLWDMDTASSHTLSHHTNSVTSLVLALVRKNEELLISATTV